MCCIVDVGRKIDEEAAQDAVMEAMGAGQESWAYVPYFDGEHLVVVVQDDLSYELDDLLGDGAAHVEFIRWRDREDEKASIFCQQCDAAALLKADYRSVIRDLVDGKVLDDAWLWEAWDYYNMPNSPPPPPFMGIDMEAEDIEGDALVDLLVKAYEADGEERRFFERFFLDELWEEFCNPYYGGFDPDDWGTPGVWYSTTVDFPRDDYCAFIWATGEDEERTGAPAKTLVEDTAREVRAIWEGQVVGWLAYQLIDGRWELLDSVWGYVYTSDREFDALMEEIVSEVNWRD